MKTFLLALSVCILAAFTSYAQTSAADAPAASILKPQSGHVATELNINPFNGSLSLNNAINQLKFRYFTTPHLAVRLGVDGSKVSSSFRDTNPYGTNSYRYEDERSSRTIGLNIGIEKHFAGTKRLSPYLGADLSITNKFTTHKFIVGQSVTNVTGAWFEYTYNPDNPSYPNISHIGEQGYFRYGINVVSGFDFYMAKNFFFGYEMNFGISRTVQQELKVEQSNAYTDTSPSSQNSLKGSSFSFGPSLMNGVRVGYVF